MNIAGIDYESVKDGDGVRTTIYVSGCSHNCYNCHNPQTHDINYGVPFTEKLQNKIIENIKKRPFISGLTLSGGDPLHENNLNDILSLVNRLHQSLPEKTIWLYTGYQFEDCLIKPKMCPENIFRALRYEVIQNIDVLVDGRYIDSQRDITLKWRGSANQRVIDVQKTLQKGEVILWAK